MRNGADIDVVDIDNAIQMLNKYYHIQMVVKEVLMVRHMKAGHGKVIVSFLLWLCGMTMVVAGISKDRVPSGEIGTVAGILEISDKEELPPPVFSIHRLLLQGKEIVRLTGDNSVYIRDAYPNAEKARLLLLELGTGGSGCPAFFRILEIKADNSTLLTDKFGTCSDLFETAYRNGTWEIAIPQYHGDAKKPERWQYRDGKLTKDGKPAVSLDDKY